MPAPLCGRRTGWDSGQTVTVRRVNSAVAALVTAVQSANHAFQSQVNSAMQQRASAYEQTFANVDCS